MNVTLTLDDELVKRLRRIAAERDTTLTAMIRDHLTQVAAEEATHGRQRRELDALERTFEAFRFRIGKRNWSRADLYDRT